MSLDNLTPPSPFASAEAPLPGRRPLGPKDSREVLLRRKAEMEQKVGEPRHFRGYYYL